MLLRSKDNSLELRPVELPVRLVQLKELAVRVESEQLDPSDCPETTADQEKTVSPVRPESRESTETAI